MPILDLSNRHNMFYWQTNRNISAEDMKKIFLDRSESFDKSDAVPAIEYGMIKTGKKPQDAKVVQVGELITDGLVNNVLKAKLADGTNIVIRMHPKDVKNGYFWVEKVAAEKAKAYGVLTYSTYIIVNDRKKFDFDFIIMEALPGETMRNFTHSGEIKYAYEEQLIRETGRQIGLIHRVKTRGFGFFDNKIAKSKGTLEGQYNSLREHFFASLHEDLEYLDNDHKITHSQQEKILALLNKNADLINCDEPALIHNDVADWNTLSDGKHITGIVDWDECISGDPVMEFSAYSLFFGEPRMTWFKEGYSLTNTFPTNFNNKFQIFKLRYLVSKLKLRVKMATVHNSPGLQRNIKRGFEAMNEVFAYFKV
ncbi:aminoglycoside phosphotransferase family protein [Patescibacteria group bacterium]|nr:aminoglycoside phosphotransferase family protein [Patescibacteria group bacterium]